MQRQAERGPPDRVQVDPAAGERVVHLALRQVLMCGDVRTAEPAGQVGDVHPEDVQRRLLGEVG